MRAWVIRATGGLDQIELTDVPSPAATLGPRDVRVGIRAAALNHLDLFVVQGLTLDYRFPHILGADGAGVVEAVGRDVATLRPGDRVMLNPGIADYSCEYCRAGEHSLCRNYRMLGEHLPGTLTESVVVPEQNIAVIPTLVPPLGWAEAAAFSLVTLTAWRMLVRSEEHTSELQSQSNLVCRLLLEKKKKNITSRATTRYATQPRDGAHHS